MATTVPLISVQLSRHPSLRPLGVQVMYGLHPGQNDPLTGQRFVPAVHTDPVRGTSIFMYPKTRYGYADRILPDGRTIEYHPSTNQAITRRLDDLVGQEVTLYVQTGRGEARTGRVVVQKPADVGNVDVFHLRIEPPSLNNNANAVPGRRQLWADM